MSELALVVVGYNRPAALERLLGSLSRVAYDGNRVPLIISVDRSDTDEVVDAARRFEWPHGEKRVRTFPERQGLKKHVLACGELTSEFEDVVVLEDDLYVSPNLYRFASAAADYFRSDDRIAGIGLYAHRWNVGCHRPFEPIDDPLDVYFQQFACSWGQVWTRAKWRSFAEWYRTNGDGSPGGGVPASVSAWSDRSWLKHHIRYCVDTNRFFAYPRVAVTTNFADRGQHNRGGDTGYQVPLQGSYRREFRLGAIDESLAVYDAFFESMTLGQRLGIPTEDLCVDLYGAKGGPSGKRYWLTLEGASYALRQSYGLALRPHEANVVEGVAGGAIKLYDTAATGKRRSAAERDAVVRYDVRNVPYKALLAHAVRRALGRVTAKITRTDES